MRVLFLTCHLPYPPFSGGRRREFELLRRLVAMHEIHLCCVTKTFEEDCNYLTVVKDLFRDIAVFRATPTWKNVTEGKIRSPLQVKQHANPEVKKFIHKLFSSLSFDLVHVEGFYLMQHLPVEVGPPVLLGTQNVEHLLYKQRASVSLCPFKGKSEQEAYHITRRCERNAWVSAELCTAVTEPDRDLMKQIEPSIDVWLVPNGCDHSTAFTLNREQSILQKPETQRQLLSAPEILLPGNFAYQPTADGAKFFLRSIWPRVRRGFPTAQLKIVGNGPDKDLRSAAKKIGAVLTGRVESLEPYLQRAAVVVCPLRVGGGIKVKIIEALRAGKAVVTTSVGVMGLEAGGRKAILVHDSPVCFADAVVRLLSTPKYRQYLEKEASRYSSTLPTWDESAMSMNACYDRVAKLQLEINRGRAP